MQIRPHRRPTAGKGEKNRSEGHSIETANSPVIWQRRHEHFTALARAAAVSGNAVDAENFYQHAEHYFRLMRGTAA